MKKWIIPIVILMTACASESVPEGEAVPAVTPEEKPIETVVEEVEVTPEAPVWPRLSNATCKDFLLDYGQKNTANRVVIHTPYGDIKVKLYDDTPIHRANFLYLIERGYFAPTQIVRIVKDFVVQGGNSEEPEDQEERFLIGDYTLPNEIQAHHIHTRGALAMSRNYEGNPEQRSSAYDFYIVDGRDISNVEFFQVNEENDNNYTDAQEAEYKKRGGAIHLDGKHTVFGEVTSGLSVIDKIADLETDASDWPIMELIVSMEVVE
ncbi:MAG: peptidylprolyl isomerase [Flavobacteriales bacterium]|nr:peptidylprolyl isomerase [Flavobacteriales bacterium]